MAAPVAITLNIDHKSLANMAQAAPELSKSAMALALGKAARSVQEYARAKHRFISRSGALERSVDYVVNADAMEAMVFLDENVAAYGQFIHEGTGKWGPSKSPYPIYPRAKRCLRFVGSDGAIVFAKKVMHPGVRPDQFLYEAAAAQTKQVQDIFDKAISDLAARLGAM